MAHVILALIVSSNDKPTMQLRISFLSSLRIKITDETNRNLKRFVKPLLKELVTNSVRRKLKGKKIEIIIPKDYGQTVYEYSIDEEKEYYDIYGHSSGQGHFCTPTDKKSRDFKIIINKSTFDSYQYFSTVFHEFVHVLDFTEYIHHYGNPTMMDRDTKHSNYYFEFYLWTEFNAKRLGLKRLVKELDKINEGIHLPASTISFIEEDARAKKQLQKLYALMHFFARISACDNGSLKFNPEIHPERYLTASFGENATVIHSILEGIKNYQDFEKEKETLRYLFDW